MKISVRMTQVLFFSVLAMASHLASAAGICDLETGTSYNILSGEQLSGGRTRYGSQFSEGLDPSSLSDGKLSRAITLKDDEGNLHILSGRIDVESINMISAPNGSYACVTLLDRDKGYEVAFQIADDKDIFDTAIPASSSGQGYGLRLMSQAPNRAGEFVFGITSPSGKTIGAFSLVKD